MGRIGGVVPSSRTRREHVRVGLVATSLSLTVLEEGTTPPLLIHTAAEICMLNGQKRHGIRCAIDTASGVYHLLSGP